MQVEIGDDFAHAGLSVNLGCLSARVRVAPSPPDLIAEMDQATRELAEALADTPPAEVTAIAQTRRAYRALGKDPTRYRPSSEALLRRVRQGKGLFRVNGVVDTNNLVSLRTGLPAGCYDLDALSPPVRLRRGRGGESYEGIGRGEIKLEGLPVLTDRDGPFGSPTSDSVRACIAPETKTMVMVVYGFGDPDVVEDALALAGSLLARHCDARALEHRVQGGGGTR